MIAQIRIDHKQYQSPPRVLRSNASWRSSISKSSPNIPLSGPTHRLQVNINLFLQLGKTSKIKRILRILYIVDNPERYYNQISWPFMNSYYNIEWIYLQTKNYCIPARSMRIRTHLKEVIKTVIDFYVKEHLYNKSGVIIKFYDLTRGHNLLFFALIKCMIIVLCNNCTTTFD